MSEEEENPSEPEKQEQEKKFVCPICDKELSTNQKLKEHFNKCRQQTEKEDEKEVEEPEEDKTGFNLFDDTEEKTEDADIYMCGECGYESRKTFRYCPECGAENEF